MILLVLCVCLLGIVTWRLSVAGKLYVVFDGGRYGSSGTYEIWCRDILGFDRLMGTFSSEKKALERVAWLKKHPPHIVKY